jgi:cytochrome c oxidase subunit 1
MTKEPTGTKIYNYMVTMHQYTDHMITARSVILLLLLTVFVILFSFGGATGVILGNSMVDMVLHDTYYVVAHFHYTRALGTSLSIVIGTLLMFDHHFSIGHAT